MKRYNAILSLSAVITCAWFAGCSKSKDAVTSPAGAGVVSTESSGPVEMKIKWVVGKRYAQQMTMNQTAHMTIPGMDKPMDQAMTMAQDFNMSAMKELPGGGTELELKFTGQKVESKMGGKVMMSFDSAQDPQSDTNNPVAPLFRKMIGAHVVYDVDADGKVEKVVGMNEFLAQLSGGNPQSEAMMKSMMSEDMIKQLAMRGQGLPEKPVKIGDHWPVHLEVNAGQVGMLIMDMKYTFKGWQQHGGSKCALLESVGDIATKPGSSTNGPMNVSVESGKLAGSTWYDPAQAMVVDSASDQNMTLNITAQGKSIKSQMKQQVSIKLVEVADIAK